MADEPEYIERDADLFEAGEYPDKGMTVTEEDLDRLAASPDAPVMIEHSGGPIRIGIATGFQRVGRWLKGKLKLLRDASNLMDTLGITGVSVAVPRELDRIIEVSWTGSPRVQNARVYSGDDDAEGGAIMFALGEHSHQEESTMADDTNQAAALAAPAPVASMTHSDVTAALADLQARYAQLEAANATHARESAESRARLEQFRAEIRARDIETKVDTAIGAGKLPPVAREFAVAIMQSDGVVRFNDADTPVSELFASMLEVLPRLIKRPLAGAGTGDPVANMTESEKAFYAKHFPGLALEDIAKFGPSAGEV